MAEAIPDDVDAGKRRRLPAWMIRANPDNKPKQHSEVHRSSSLSHEKPEVKVAGSELKSITKIKPIEAINSSSRFDAGQSSNARKRKRKSSRKNAVNDYDSLANDGIAKAGREEDDGGPATVDNGAAADAKKRRSRRHKQDAAVCSPTSENEVELTVEDLVRIAEEYVNADKQKQLECSSAREEHRLEILPKTSSGSLGVCGLNQTLSRCTTMPTPEVSASSLYEEKNPEAETPAVKFLQTGDATQGMLELLLGPLLKKQGPKVVDEREAVDTESIMLNHDPNRPSTLGREICKDEALPTKRKSSLKDKVAMLLDDWN